MSVEHEPVSCQLVSQLSGDDGLQALDLIGPEFDHRAALRVYQMVMMDSRCRLDLNTTSRETMLLDEAGCGEDLQSPVDGRQRDTGIDRSDPAMDLGNVGVIVGLRDDVGDNPTWSRDALPCQAAVFDQ